MTNEKIIRIDYTKHFLKQLKKAPIEIKIAFRNRLSLFIKNTSYPQLRDHQLKGLLSFYRSINITGDWRALYTEVISRDGRIIIFEALGTHSQLYR